VRTIVPPADKEVSWVIPPHPKVPRPSTGISPCNSTATKQTRFAPQSRVGLDCGFTDQIGIVLARCKNPERKVALTTRGHDVQELNMSGGTEPTITLTGLRELPLTEELSEQNTDPAPVSQPFAAERDWPVAAEGAGVLILESLEHAQGRNAEILAEIVGAAASEDATDLTRPDGAFPAMETTLKHVVLRDDEAAMNVDSTAPGSEGAIETSAPIATRPTMLYVAESKRAVGRLTVIASLLVLALLTGIFYRHDLRIAADQMRRALAVAVARLSSRLNAVDRAAPATTQEKVPMESPAAGSPGPARTTLAVPLPPWASKQINGRSPQGENTAPPTADHGKAPEGQLTVTVVAQSNDTLRQICLRYVGRYDTELVNRIRELNPQLSDLDYIIVGESIVLPGSGTVGTTAPGPN
jgi:phage tail protein X